MGQRLPQTTPRKMLKALKKLGFVVRSVEGSHYHMKRGNQKTIVAYHSGEMSRDLLMSTLKQAGLTVDEIRPYL